MSYQPNLNNVNLWIQVKEQVPECIVVHETKVKKEALRPHVRLVICAGAGTENVDMETCNAKAIYVVQCDDLDTCAIAEAVIGLMINVDRRICEQTQLLKQGEWHKASYTKCLGLKDSVLGLVGYSKVAQQVLKVALALGMRVVVYTREWPKFKPKGFHFVTLDDLLEQSDFVSLHLEVNEQTEGIVDDYFLGQMKPTAVLVNTEDSRLVEEKDLLHKLKHTRAFWCALDCYDKMPIAHEITFKNELTMHPRCLAMHNIASTTEEVASVRTAQILKHVQSYTEGQVSAAN